MPSGNYVVVSGEWNKNEGAVTWCNGATGVTGTISAANSLIGWGISYGRFTVTPLTNGNYVVADADWNQSIGVVSWGSGTSGVTGVVSADNSLVGTVNDQLGYNVIALTNGNFVADGIGTATWGSGRNATISGTVSAANSMVGGGSYPAKVTPSPTATTSLISPAGRMAGFTGALTWGNGTTGTTGTVSPDNSLVGSDVGYTALAYGGYAGGVTAWPTAIMSWLAQDGTGRKGRRPGAMGGQG